MPRLAARQLDGLVDRDIERRRDPCARVAADAQLIASALERLRGKGAYSTTPARLLPEVFTLSELQQVYETVMGEHLDASAFRRKVADLELLEEVVGEKRQTATARRPTTLYRLKGPVSVFERKIGAVLR